MGTSTTTWATDCEGVMVLHRDGSRECLEPDCVDREVPHDVVDVPCGCVLGDDCPRCGPQR